MSDFDNFDELDAVRDFRSTLAVLEPDADARIRARIVELARTRAAGEREREAGDLIVLEPIVDLRSSDSRVPATSRSSDVAPAAAVVELPAARQPSALRPTRLMAAAAAIVIVVLASTFAVRSRATDPRTDIQVADAPTTTTAALTLAELAGQVRALPATVLAPGQYLHTTNRVGIRNGQARSELTLEKWVDQTNRGRSQNGQTVVFSFGPTATSTNGVGPIAVPLGTANSTPFAGVFTYDEMIALPTDPAALGAAIETAAESAGFTASTLSVELELLSMPLTSGALRAALYDLIASQGFVSVGDRTLDPATGSNGTGAGFERTVDGTTFTLVFDRTSGRPVGFQHLVTTAGAPSAPDAPVGTLLDFAVYGAPDITTVIPS